jgi:hypothetical protein
MSGDARIPALDRMGANLEQALVTRRRRRWWLRPALIAAGVCAALAVPAAATQIDWARLVDGETALPTQAPAGVKTVLARGDDRTVREWRVVAYRARLAGAGGAIGLCAYVVGLDGGTGRCVPRTGAPALLVASGDAGTTGVIAGLASAGAERVELTMRDGRALAVAPQAPDTAMLRESGLPADLRFFVVRAAPGAALAGAIARDSSGRELGRSGRPSRLPASAPLLESPVTLAGGERP